MNENFENGKQCKEINSGLEKDLNMHDLVGLRATSLIYNSSYLY
jgi:hypothetical protein